MFTRKFDEIYPEQRSCSLTSAIYKTSEVHCSPIGYSMSRSVLDGRGIRRYPSSCMQRLTYFREFTVRVCSREVRLRFSQSQHSVQFLTDQLLDGLDAGETDKRYIHHYNFPSYSVGEAKPSRSPGRREIGHGALAERALRSCYSFGRRIPVCTSPCFGSSFVQTVLLHRVQICGSTLALMDCRCSD